MKRGVAEMNKPVRLWVAVLSGALLLALALPSNADRKSQTVSPTLKACVDTCKSEKDPTAYEACAIKCNQDEKKRKAAATKK
jgi:hypothetical protein